VVVRVGAGALLQLGVEVLSKLAGGYSTCGTN